MCGIWRDRSGNHLRSEPLAAEAEDWLAAGLRRLVLTGGEALLHPDLWTLVDPLHRRGVGLSLLSSGPGLVEEAGEIARRVDDLVISLDGPPHIHDRIRGQAGAFDHLADGLEALRSLSPGLAITARYTVQRGNCTSLVDALEAAGQLGIDRVSFLAVDAHSSAFQRGEEWSSTRRNALLPVGAQIDALAEQIAAIEADPRLARSTVETPAKLRARLVEHFRALEAGRLPEAGRCNAPLVSAVIEADGTVRPCFFHRSVGRWPRDGRLLEILAGSRARAFEAAFDPSRDPTCRRCVCRLDLVASSDGGAP